MKTLQKIKELYSKYFEEMVSMSAWCAHAYAPDYLKELETEAIEVLKEIKTHEAKTAIFKLQTNYSALIAKVYEEDDLSLEEKSDISDSLSETYLNRFEDAFLVIKKFYEYKTNTTLIPSGLEEMEKESE